MIDAGEIVGLRVNALISDTTAALAQLALDKSIQKPSKDLIFDIGAGHCQVAVVEMRQGKIEVLASAADPYIGGVDFDNILLDHFLKELKLRNKSAPDLRKNAKAMRQLQVQCEKAKVLLSTNATCKIGADGKGLNFISFVTREKFHELTSVLLSGITDLFDDALQDAETDRSALNNIYILGGSSKLPVVQDLVKDLSLIHI